MREDYNDDNYSINSNSSQRSPHMYNERILKRNYGPYFSNFENNMTNNSNLENNTTNFESNNNNLFTKIPTRNAQLNQNRQRNYNQYNLPSINYNSNLDNNNIGYKRNLPINEFIPKNSTTWNKIIDFFFNW